MVFWGNRKQPSSASDRDAGVLSALDTVQGVAWYDVEGTLTRANTKFAQIMGFTVEDIVGQQHKSFVEAESASEQTNRAFWAALQRGEAQVGKVARVDRAGNSLWLEGSYTPILDSNGAVTEILQLAIDVTEARKTAVDTQGQLNAFSRSLCMIEFDLQGQILDANDNFLSAMGYERDEVVGRKHRIFMREHDLAKPDYEQFWDNLRSGEFQSGQFCRVTKSGQEVWIQASYNPIFDLQGRLDKIVKIASDITQEKLAAADAAGQLNAVSKSMAVIEFDLDGTIRTANANFLDRMGYTLAEVSGQHHRIFMPPEEAQSPEYTAFWNDLASGEHKAGEFCRIAKDRSEVWINASYNPIVDPQGRVYKVVKCATDVTERKHILNALTASLKQMDQGDLTPRLRTDYSEEFTIVSQSFNATMDRLQELVVGITDAANAIADETRGIAENAQDLSKRSESQAANVVETSAAIEEISQTISSSASNAKLATTAAQGASTNADAGMQVVTEAVSAMGNIEQSASKIGQVVDVIDDIAFQTNLLALNAGVEAARAGEAGNGFAVVASEVRALAMKAADSARQISELIAASNETVAHGAKLVGGSGTSLREIQERVQGVVVNISDIQRASQEQTTGIQEVTKAVADIDSTVQTTAVLAEKSAVAAQVLARRADSLKELVQFFDAKQDPSNQVEQRSA